MRKKNEKNTTVKWIDNDPMNGAVIEWDKIHKEFEKYNIPSNVYHVNLPWDKANLFVVFSKRDTGKTTNVLLHALIAYWNYGVKLEWIRQKDDMIKPTNTESMFNTILQFNYIEKITHGRFSSIYYYRKEMFLCNYDGSKGRPKDIDDTPFMRFNAISDMQQIKSNYTSPRGDLIVLDEFQTNTTLKNEFVDFFHIVSTIKRKRISTKILMLGNTITPYNYYFREMDLTRTIIQMNVHDKRLIRTKYGMNVYLEWTEPDHDCKKKSERERNNELQYYGFDGLNSIIGGGTWEIRTYPHLDREIDRTKEVIIDYYLKFELFTILMRLCYHDELGYFVFCRPTKNIKEEHYVFTNTDVFNKYEIYGTGKGIKFFDNFWKLRDLNKFYYSTNDIGEMVEEYLNSLRK